MTPDEQLAYWAAVEAAYIRGYNDALEDPIIEGDAGWEAYRDELLKERKQIMDAIFAFVWGGTPNHPVTRVDGHPHTYRVTLPGDKVVVIKDVSKYADEMVPWR